MRYIMMGMVLGLCLNGSVVYAENERERASLKGLPGVYIQIEEIVQDVVKDGLTKADIRTAVELILRSSGVPVLTKKEWLSTESGPYLYVRVGTFLLLSYSYYVEVSLFQYVSLIHTPEGTMAITWDSDILGSVERDRLSMLIPFAIEPQIKEFANDYLTVNPR